MAALDREALNIRHRWGCSGKERTSEGAYRSKLQHQQTSPGSDANAVLSPYTHTNMQTCRPRR